jgi:hypothetical protein
VKIAKIYEIDYASVVNKKTTTEGTVSRIISTAALAALWLIAYDMAPASVSNTPALSGSAHAGPTTVKSSKSNTSDRKGGNKKSGNPPAGGPPGGRGY